jgi:diadenosine tetraphosphate (Ap4A) HIT family hydrolase
MANWKDAEKWEGLLTGRTCPICVDQPNNIVAELEGCWLTMRDKAAPALPGTCALFLQRHRVELHELDAEEAAQFMSAVQRVSAALHEVSGAVKMNYEVHGNTIPHLHMHFFPRYCGDPFGDGPIDPSLSGKPDDFRKHLEIRSRLIERLVK